MYCLYKSVFGNIVISNEIFKHSRLYKKNECVEFNDREALLEYPEREYIRYIFYDGEALEKGDLSECRVLKSITIDSYDSYDLGVIPFGVEMVECNEIKMSTLKELPKTVHTLKNIRLHRNDIYIPPNITSIYLKVLTPELDFKQFESIKTLSIFMHANGTNKDMDIKLPQSLTKLELLHMPSKIQSNVIPNGILSLVIDRIDILDRLPSSLAFLKLYETPLHCYTFEESFKLISILPQSLTKLTVPDSFEAFNFTYPSNIKTIKFR